MNPNGFAEIVRDEIVENGQSVTSLSKMEGEIRVSLQQLGALWLGEWLSLLSRHYTASDWMCPKCRGDSKYERQREASLHTMLGSVCYKRAVYACEDCGNRHYPMDEALGLRPNEMSAEIERLATQIGVHMPFAQASTLFEELTLVSLSDQSIDKATQAYGEEVSAVEQEQLEAASLGEKPSVAPLRLYGSIDGGRVRTRAPKGEEQAWREVKIGAWYQARGVPAKKPDDKWTIQAHDILYYSDIALLKTLVTYFGQVGYYAGQKT